MQTSAKKAEVKLSNSLAQALTLAVLALIPARVLHTENWDPTNCVCEKTLFFVALKNFVGSTLMDRSMLLERQKTASITSIDGLLGRWRRSHDPAA